MKTIKFTPKLTQLIKEGSKTTTFRLFDDKNLTVGDKFIMATRDGEVVTDFGKALITGIEIATLGTLKPENYHGHEKLTTDPVTTYRQYYGDKVTIDTEVKIIRFEVLELYR